MLIEKVQQYFEKLYDIRSNHRAINYLVDHHQAIKLLSLHPDAPIPDEMFLVSQNDDDEAEIALYLHPKIIQNLEKNNPFININENNLNDFCLMMEGVSHFSYFLYQTDQDHKITQLEMELQAEIDKFMMFYIYLESVNDPKFCKNLFDQLFEKFSLLENLNYEEQHRYLQASSLAARYCNKLKEYFPNRENIPELITELRSLYRLNQQDKIHHINSLSKAHLQYGFV
jgi:hypothetical protein